MDYTTLPRTAVQPVTPRRSPPSWFGNPWLCPALSAPCGLVPNLIYWNGRLLSGMPQVTTPGPSEIPWMERTMPPEDHSMLDEDVAEVRRRLEGLLVELRSLGLDVDGSIEEYGTARDPEGILTRTVNVNVTVWDRNE